MRPFLMATLMLAGCGEPLSQSEGAAEGSDVVATGVIAAGEWEFTRQLRSLQEASAVEPSVGKRYLPPHEVVAPPARVIADQIGGNNCDIAGLRVSDGHINGTMACKGGSGVPAHVQTVTGTFSRENLSVTVDTLMFGQVYRETFVGRWLSAP